MEAHSLAGWVGWSAGLSGAVHLGILLKRFAHTRNANAHNFTSPFSLFGRNLWVGASTADKLGKIG